MPFEAILGNAAALTRLRGILEHRRLAHAYLLAGPEGVGKKLAALEFAKALGAVPTLIQRPKDKREILIDQIRGVIRELSYTSSEPRADIFDEADRMSEEGMNALLKTLEEPPPHTVLILITSVAHRLLSTIRSRCQTIYFSPLSQEETARYAAEKLGLDLEPARAVSILSEGSIGRAMSLAEEIPEIVESARTLQEQVLKGELNPIIEALGKIRDAGKSRQAAKRHLSLLAECLREALKSRTGSRPCLASPAFVQRMAALDEDALLDRIETLMDHQCLIDKDANVGLAVEDALLRI